MKSAMEKERVKVVEQGTKKRLSRNFIDKGDGNLILILGEVF